MDNATTVPLVWLFVLSGIFGSAVIGALLWWLRQEFDRIAEQHKGFREEIAGVHKRVDYLISRLVGKPYDEREHA